MLFDASLEHYSGDESEDWGEFETAEATPGETLTKGLHGQKPVAEGPNRNSSQPDRSSSAVDQLDFFDSLSMEDNSVAPNRPSNPPTNEAHTSQTIAPAKPVFTKPISTKAAPTKTVPTKPVYAKPISTKPQAAEPDDSFEEWGDFIDGPPEEPPRPRPTQRLSSNKPTKPRPESPQAFGIAASAVPATQVRPTNIPPPSVLLEVFPRLFEQLREDATAARKNPQETENLERVASLVSGSLKAAARVVAGRTLRWKRDTILSQSMKIGPARAGKSGGMKLNTVNRNEDIKEQQEAVDVITIWRERTALFNSAIQAAGGRPVPVIPANTRVITATAAQGAIKASHACALCGLKRDERLPKLDDAVQDSFGEWWTDHWGHTDCRLFWENNMHLLHQR